MHDFDELVTFVRVVEAASLTRAAQRLGVTKSVVSRRLASLEERLKARLVTRAARGAAPTELGRTYYEHCVRILAELDEATAGVSGLNARAWGTLRVAAPMTFGNMHLMPVLAEVLEANPDLVVDVDLNDRVVDIVAEGFDLALRIGNLRDSSLIARRLAPVRRVLCASPSYVARRGAPAVPDDLFEHDCLAYSNASSSEVWRFVSDPPRRPIPVRRLRANNGEMLRDACVAGLGIAALPTFIIGPAVSRGELVVLMRDRPLEELGLYAVYPPNRHLAHKVRLLVDAMARRFGPEPYWDLACGACREAAGEAGGEAGGERAA
jgi:DNA-binding transcriptional LysR family regulator